MTISPHLERLPSRMDYTVVSTGCHLWNKALNSRGYGVLWFDGKLHLAHRLAWLIEHGDWPRRDLVLDHICEVKDCVNAAHLRESTNGANIMRAYPRGDAATERRRAGNRAAKARMRAKRGGSNQLV